MTEITENTVNQISIKLAPEASELDKMMLASRVAGAFATIGVSILSVVATEEGLIAKAENDPNSVAGLQEAILKLREDNSKIASVELNS
jgi:hypothetical protein